MLVDVAGSELARVHKTQVTVGDDAQQFAVRIHYGQPRDAVLTAQRVKFSERGIGPHCDWVGDHSGFRALHDFHVVRLIGNGEVPVQNPDATQAR